MSDLGSTTFGYVIAYLLPGLAGSVAVALLSKHAEKIFHVVITQQNLAPRSGRPSPLTGVTWLGCG